MQPNKINANTKIIGNRIIETMIPKPLLKVKIHFKINENPKTKKQDSTDRRKGIRSCIIGISFIK